MAARKQNRGWDALNQSRGRYLVPLDPWHIAQLRQFQAHRRLITLHVRG